MTNDQAPNDQQISNAQAPMAWSAAALGCGILASDGAHWKLGLGHLLVIGHWDWVIPLLNKLRPSS